MAEIRNGLVVVRSAGEGDAPSLAVGTSAAGGLGVSAGGLVRRKKNDGVYKFPTPPPSPGGGFSSLDPSLPVPELGEERSHFLDSCFLCKRPLGKDRDIFMYRGNIPFCSEECRQDQMDADEMKNRKWSNLAAKAMLSARKKDGVPVNRATGTVVAG